MKGRSVTIIALVFVILLPACSSSNKETQKASIAPAVAPAPQVSNAMADYGAQIYMDYSSPEGYTAEASYDYQINGLAGGSPNLVDETPVSRADKVIMNGDALLETDEFDQTIAYIRNMVDYFKGYTSSSNLYTITDKGDSKRRYTAVIKVPAEHFGNAFDMLKALKGLKNASQRQENVSEQYSDSESRLATRKIEEERLLSLISKATQISDILSLERRLSEVRTDIELYESRLKNIDRLVAYSTININVYEVSKVSSDASSSFGGRIIDAFVSSIELLLAIAQGFTYIFAASVIPFIILAVVIMIVLSIIKRVIKRN